MLRCRLPVRAQRLPARALGRRLARNEHPVGARSRRGSSSAAVRGERDGLPFRDLAQTFAAIELAPPHEGVELRFGTRSFAPVVEQLLSTTADDGAALNTKLDMTTFSDFGTAVQSLIRSGSIVIPDADADLDSVTTISFVHQELLRLASEEGSGAVVRKQQRAVQLLKQCRSAEEMVFIVRMLAVSKCFAAFLEDRALSGCFSTYPGTYTVGFVALVAVCSHTQHQSLRIGMGEKSILAALAIASASPPSSGQPVEDDAADSKAPTAAPSMKAWVESVTKVYAQQPNYTALAQLLFEARHEQDLVKKIEWLDGHASPTVGIPVLTMSANPVSSVAGVIDRIQKTSGKSATCEYKYDGARVQIHLSFSLLSSKQVVGRIFSRNMEDNTEKYGSLLEVLARQLHPGASSSVSDELRELIVEGEVVAVDRATQRFLPFQVLQTKTTTDFCLFVFDLLHLNGEKLTHRPLRERRDLLRSHLVEAPGYLEFVKSRDFKLSDESLTNEEEAAAVRNSDASVVRGFLSEAVAAGCEGLMIKTLDGDDADYKAGVRSYSWMKVKQDYLSEDASPSSKQKSQHTADHGTFLPDTLDLVPIGAFHGKGRRSGVFGSFLMATYDAVTGKFETIGKVGTGFSDSQLSEVSQRLKLQTLDEGDGSVPDMISSAAIRSRQPDVWLNPSEVWEIKATQLTSSPSYTCASQLETEPVIANDADDGAQTATASGKGLALRFPRFVRFRTDKNPEQATESSQVAELFRQQTANQNGENDQ